MEYQALYRKYRPQKFSDVVDQENILKILTNSIKEGKISHAYLFSGPRGTGKTTIAKLVAKTINCLNLQEDFSVCSECENCKDIEENSPDIIEIDAASNNGVDEIRELKSKINLVPNKLKYKVYIIDEVHMLSISAFNALLKTLEEPPSHVVFILATTEFYKVPTTIVSRCQCLNFTRIKTSSIESRLKEIAKKEKIKITDDAIHEIAMYSDGGLRDALGMLDKLASYSLKQITADDFLRINGLISKKDIDTFIEKILNKDSKQVIETLNKFDELGYDFSKLIEKILEELRDLLVKQYTETNDVIYNPKDLYNLILCFNEAYNMLKEAANRKIIIEVKLLMFMNDETIEKQAIDKNIDSNANITPKLDIKPQITPLQDTTDKNESKEIDETKEIKMPIKNYSLNEKVKQQRINNTFALASKLLKNMAMEKWTKIENYLTDSQYSEIAGLLEDCKIAVASKKNLIITTKYQSILDKIYNQFNLVSELINKIMESEYDIVFIEEKDFQEEVTKYKIHMNDKEYYTYQEEQEEFIKLKDKVEKEEEVCYSNLVEKAINTFGKEFVDIE